MAFLSEIQIVQFRNFHAASFNFNSPVVGITGSNGVGKTNLLDAVYYLCYTKSYFQGKERFNVQHDRAGFRLEGLWKGLPPRPDEKTRCIWREGKKTVFCDGVPYPRVTDHIGKHHAVMIAPDDLELINGGSELRRKFMDGMLAQSEPRYLEALLAYQKSLMQRNAYLKQTLPSEIRQDVLEAYDTQLSRAGATLIEGRGTLSASIPDWLQSFYEQLSGGREAAAMTYQPSTEPDQLLSGFRASRRRDISARRSTFGPHLEDWQLTLNASPLKQHASQGQKKSFLIALKLAQIQWLQQQNKKPLLLLDDIFEKLDRRRLERLFSMLAQFAPEQLLMTHTARADIENIVKNYNYDLQIIELS